MNARMSIIVNMLNSGGEVISRIHFAPVPRLLVLALLGGCASTEMMSETYQTPKSFPKEFLAEFCYEPTPISEEMVLIKEKKSYRIYETVIDAGLDGSDDESSLKFEYYEQKSDTASPVVLLLPILNGKKHVMRPFATHFAKDGYAVIIVDTVQRRTLLNDLKNPEAAIRLTIQRHRRVIDWAESKPEIDTTRLGVFGASLGAFNALYLAALDERVSVASTALVGGSLPYVLLNSNEPRIERSVASVKEELSFDDEQLGEYLTEEIVTDTLLVAPHMHADRVLMVLAKRDKAVPYDSQLNLHDAMGRPQAITLPTGHYTAAAYIFYLRSQVLKFFNQKLADEVSYGTAAIEGDHCEATPEELIKIALEPS